MSKLVSISINVDLLDESKFYKGKKGTYLNISGFLKEDPDNYGNFGFITQDGVKTPEKNAPILGNFKIGKSLPARQDQASTGVKKLVNFEIDEINTNDLPF
jgi:hypothetical protein